MNRHQRRAAQKLARHGSARASASGSIDADFEAALALHQAGLMGEAATAYKAVLSQAPDHGPAIHHLGIIAYQQGQPELAAELIGEALQRIPDDPRALSDLCLVLQSLQRTDEAVSAGERAIAAERSPEALNNLANAYQAQQRWHEAEGLYREALSLRPDYVEATVNLGNALHIQGRLDEAIGWYRQALMIQPHNVKALLSLGATLGQLDEFEEAVQILGQALAYEPGNTSARLNLASAYYALGRTEDAVAALVAAASHAPEDPEPLLRLAAIAAEHDQWEQAERTLTDVVNLHPDSAAALLHLGNVQQTLGRFAEAAESAQRLIALTPQDARAHNNLGTALAALGRLDDALAAFDTALAADALYANALYNKATVLEDAGRVDEAREHYARTLIIDPQHTAATINLSALLAKEGEYDQALLELEQAADMGAANADIAYNRGSIHRYRGELDAAVACFDQAIAERPEHYDALHNRALTHLAKGDYDRGWAEYEWRWYVPGAQAPRQFPQAHWDGSAIDGGRLLVWGEQGLGDEIFFGRIAARAAQRERLDVVLECHPRLEALFRRSFPNLEVVSRREPPAPSTLAPGVRAELPAGSLPSRVPVAGLPAADFQLQPDPALVAEFRAQHRAAFGERRIIGLSWSSGSPMHGRRRSVPLPALEPVLRLSDCAFLNLQHEADADEIAWVRNTLGAEIAMGADPAGSMDDYAAQIAALDHVVTVDNTVAHLAGALGVSGHVLLPQGEGLYWVWGTEGQACAWYPCLTLVRQQAPGRWDEAVAVVAGVLAPTD